MDEYGIIKKQISQLDEKDEESEINIKEQYESEEIKLINKDTEFIEINELYDECLKYLKDENNDFETADSINDPDYESIKDKSETEPQDKEDIVAIAATNEVKYEFKTNNKNSQDTESEDENIEKALINKTVFKIENELKSNESLNSIVSENRSERLRKLSQQLPKIIITQSNASLNVRRHDDVVVRHHWNLKFNDLKLKEHDHNLDKPNAITKRRSKKYSAFDSNNM